MGTSTRKIAEKLWGKAEGLPADRDPADLVEELYAAENEGKGRTLRFPGYDRHDLPRCEPA